VIRSFVQAEEKDMGTTQGYVPDTTAYDRHNRKFQRYS